MLTRDNTKHLVAIVTALAGLATAVKSCTDSSAQAELVATRKVYSVIAARIATQDEQIQKLHDDDLELRAYVSGFKEAVERTTEAVSMEPARSPLRFPTPLRSRVALSTTAASAMPDGVRVLPPPPAPKAAPSFQKLPAFDSLR
jgi:hypothetical protein